MRIIVTGSTGGIGRAVVERLHPKHQVHCYDPWAGVDQRGDYRIFLPNTNVVVVCHGLNEPTTPYRNERVWQANVWSVVDLAKEFVQNCNVVGRKVFIAITSNSAAIPRSKSLDYCAGKAAVDMALRVMQRDHALAGFEFHSLAAGHVDTPMFERMSEMLGAEVMKAGYQRSPFKHLIAASDVAELVGFIAEQPAAKWLSGNTLRFDGGEH
jgi:NAD(P)-dependent dehydrogenase (short-subunit alcohol dehydrogenase family)